jgi:ribosome biogenesis protein UTP30
MAKDNQQLTTKVAGGTPYQLDRDQVYRASLALSKHLDASRATEKSKKRKSNLLDDDEADEEGDAIPIWVIMTAKKHIHDSNRLKPGTIPLPHPYSTSENSRVCLITPDPPASSPKAYKELVKHPKFGSDLSASIAKVIKVSSLRAKYKSFESLRKLYAEYDVFLADERVIHMLPQILGKVFYKTTTKRPVPVSLTGRENWGKKETQPKVYKITKKEKGAPGPDTVGQPQDVAVDIRKALGAALVHLSQSPTTAVRVARSGWHTDWVVDNVEAVVEGLVERFIPKKWRNVKSIHLKGPNTAALPIWLADELWQDEEDILDVGEEAKAIETKKSSKKDAAKKKRSREEDPERVESKLRKEKLRKLKHDTLTAATKATSVNENERE